MTLATLSRRRPPATRGDGVVAQALLGQTDEPLIRWDWLANHKDVLWQRAVQHVQLTVVSVALGLVLAGVLAALIRRWRWTGGPITAVVTLLYAIPSIALFAALLPMLGTGIVVPTVALTTYSLVVLTPFLVEAFDGVPARHGRRRVGHGVHLDPALLAASSCRWPCPRSSAASGSRP